MEQKKKRPNADERQGIMTIDMMTRSFDVAFGYLKKRMEGYRYTKRDLGQIRGALKRLLNYAYESMGEDFKDILNRQSRDYVLTVERRGSIRREQEIVMPLEDEWLLINLALEERCHMCILSGRECRECKLRRLLNKYVSEPEESEFEGCGFQNVELCTDTTRMNKQEKV